MASLQQTSAASLTMTGSFLPGSSSDQSPWTKLSFTPGNSDWTHIRTPIPANNTALAWYPIIVEFMGWQGTQGGTASKYYEGKFLVNQNGGNGAWYTPALFNQSGLQAAYQSTNQYNGAQRVCFSLQSYTDTNPLQLWVRFWARQSYWDSHSYGYTWSNSATGAF